MQRVLQRRVCGGPVHAKAGLPTVQEQIPLGLSVQMVLDIARLDVSDPKRGLVTLC